MMTKVEILVVALIVGLMGLLSGAAVLTARAHTRDVTRLAHIREVQMGLEMYFQDTNSYPVADGATALGTALTACLSQDGFTAPCGENATTPYLASVPAIPPQGLRELSSCSGLASAYCYAGNADEYRIQFELEGTNSALGLRKGLNCATETGLKSGACTDLSSATE